MSSTIRLSSLAYIKIIPTSDTVTFHTIFAMFPDTFSGTNNLMRHKNTVWKTNKIVFESEIVSREGQALTVRKTSETERPGEIYQNQENLGGTRIFDISA